MPNKDLLVIFFRGLFKILLQIAPIVIFIFAVIKTNFATCMLCFLMWLAIRLETEIL